MKHYESLNVTEAEVVLSCSDLDETLDFYVEKLGFVVDAICPADAPQVAILSAFGLRLRLEIGADLSPVTLRLLCKNPPSSANGGNRLVAPNGTIVEFVDASFDHCESLDAVQFSLSRLSDDSAWVKGRVGMRYRDLIPRPLGGGFAASHINVAEAGPMKDYVHYHLVRFQMIFCYKGWVKVVAEDQGPPFVMHPGDCILQPPEIRHRVLESSADLHVVELSCPAGHETHADRTMVLPTTTLNPDRDFSGQRFVFHQAKNHNFVPWLKAGFEVRDLGVASASGGLAQASVLRALNADSAFEGKHQGEFLFFFLLEGKATLSRGENAALFLDPGDSFVLPRDEAFRLASSISGTEWLCVSLPAELTLDN